MRRPLHCLEPADQVSLPVGLSFGPIPHQRRSVEVDERGVRPSVHHSISATSRVRLWEAHATVSSYFDDCNGAALPISESGDAVPLVLTTDACLGSIVVRTHARDQMLDRLEERTNGLVVNYCRIGLIHCVLC